MVAYDVFHRHIRTNKISDTIRLSIFLTVIFSCGIVMRRVDTIDYTITHRNLILGIGTLFLFLWISAAQNLSVPKILPFAFGFFLVTLVTLIWAINFGEAAYKTVRAFMAVIILYVASIEIRKNFNAVIKTMVLLALLLGAYGVLEYISHPGPAWASARIGTMGNMNLCSSAHVLLIPFSVYALRYSSGWKIASILALITALFVIFTLRTRSAWLALFLCMLVSTIHNRKLFFVTIGCIVIVGISLYCVKGSSVLNSTSLIQRSSLWNASMKMYKNNLWGVGAGNWRVAMPVYARYFYGFQKEMGFKTQQWNNPHNDFIEVLTETGFIGLFVYVGMFVSGLYYAAKKKCVLGYSLLTAYIVIACFSFPGQRIFHTVILLVTFGIIASKYKPRRLNMNPYLCNVMILAMLSFGIYVFSVRHIAEKRMYIVNAAKKYKDWNAVLYHTSNVSIFASLDYYNTPILSYRGIANFNKGNYEIALRNQIDAHRQHPSHIYPLMNIPSCLLKLGRVKEALTWYEITLNMFPGYSEAESRYLQAYYETLRPSKHGPYRSNP